MNNFLHPQSTPAAVDTLTQQEIGEMLAFSRLHSLYPVVYDAVRTTDAFAQLPEQVRMALRQETRRVIIGQTLRTEAFLPLYQRILDAGITVLVVKGIVVRELYTHPDYRISSDEDILVRKEDFFRLDEVLRREGFTAELGEHPLQEHEITYWHTRSGIHLEIHLSLFPESSDAYGCLNEPFADVFERQTAVEIRGVPIHTLEPTEHMLYLICHGLKHFLHSGFGIRQVMDMVLFAEEYGSRINWITVEGWARKLGFYLFWMNLCDLGEKYLGFSWEKAGLHRPQNLQLDCENMLEDLLDSGIYGKSSEERVHSSNMTLQAAAGAGGKGGLMASLFPGYEYMKTGYPYLERRKWLLPVAWGQRAVGYLRRSDREEIRQTMSTGRQRVELLKQYGLTGQRRKS